MNPTTGQINTTYDRQLWDLKVIPKHEAHLPFQLQCCGLVQATSPGDFTVIRLR